MVMEASPTSSLEVPELLFEFLVIPLDAPAQLRERDEAVEGDVFRNGRKPELRGFSSSVGHSTRSHSSSRGTLRSKSRCAARTRTRAKREIRTSALPSRQEIISQASAGSESARPSTDWGWWSGSRTMRLVGRPRPDQGLTAGDGLARVHTEVCGWTPAT